MRDEEQKLYDILVGSRLIKVTDYEIVIQKDGKEYTLYYNAYNGDCCGWAEVQSKMLFEEGKNPAITNVVFDRTPERYGDQEYGDQDLCKITIFGEDRAIAESTCFASSGSGWCYGATVIIECRDLNLHEELVSW